MTQADLDDARVHAMLLAPHDAHAIAALTDAEVAEDAATVSEADPDDDSDDTDTFDDDDADSGDVTDELEVDPEADAQ